MNNGDTPPPTSGLSLAPQDPPSDAQSAAPKRSRTDELLANSSLSLLPVEDEASTHEEPAASEPIEEIAPSADGVSEPIATVAETAAEAVVEVTEATETTEALNTQTTEEAFTPTLAAEPEAEVAEAEIVAETLENAELGAVISTDLDHVATEALALEPLSEVINDSDAIVEPIVDASTEALVPTAPLELEPEAEISAAQTPAEAISGTASALSESDEVATDTATTMSEPEAVTESAPVVTADEPEPLIESAAAKLPSEPEVAINAPTLDAELQLDGIAADEHHDAAIDQAISAAESDAAALFAPAPSAPVVEKVTPAPDVKTPDAVSSKPETAVANTQEMPAITPATLAAAPVVAEKIEAAITTPVTGKAVFEAKPIQSKVVQPEMEIPPPPVKKLVIPPPAPAPAPVENKAETDEKAKSGGLFGKIGAWKGHLNYLHTLYKEDPSTAVTMWKQSYKERDALNDALKSLQERQNADNFSWDEIPRVLGQFHLRDEDRGQADWYGDAARQYQLVLAALEKQKAFKPQIVQPLMKELKFIAEADAFHQKFGLTAVQQKVKTMYMTLQHRIDEYMKLQKQQLEIAAKDKEMEKLRAQEAIATAEAQKVAQENRLVQEQRLKVVEDKKRLEAKRAAEDAERARLERQREIEAEQAEHRRREELSASFRAIEQEELMKKALQNMSLSQCAEGLLRQLFEKDNLSETEKAAAARVLDVLKAKLG